MALASCCLPAMLAVFLGISVQDYLDRFKDDKPEQR
jgi:hypothetical protein